MVQTSTLATTPRGTQWMLVNELVLALNATGSVLALQPYLTDEVLAALTTFVREEMPRIDADAMSLAVTADKTFVRLPAAVAQYLRVMLGSAGSDGGNIVPESDSLLSKVKQHPLAAFSIGLAVVGACFLVARYAIKRRKHR